MKTLHHRLKWIAITLFTLLVFQSCRSVLMGVFGIKNPDIEDSVSLIKYCEKKGINTNNLYTLSAEDNVKILNLIGNSIPEIKIFNSHGQLIPYKPNPTYDHVAVFSIIDSLNFKKDFREDTSISYSDLADKLRNLNGHLNAPQMNPETKYYFFIFWTKWTGMLNKTTVIPWENQALSNPNAKVEVYKVNMDMQQYWKISKEDYMQNLERSGILNKTTKTQ